MSKSLAILLLVCLGAWTLRATDVSFTTAQPIANLQTTIDGLSAGDRVLLGDGLYAPNYTIQLTNGVSLVGSHYTNCVIRPTGGRRVMILDNASTCVSNVTITGGASSGWDHGGAFVMNDGVISHCMVSNCTTSSNARGGGGKILGGTIRYSVFAFNTSAESGGGLFIGEYGNVALPKTVLIERCLFYKNTSGKNGGGIKSYSNTAGAKYTLRHCTIANNTATGVGGLFIQNKGVCESIESCIFADNVQTVTASQPGRPNWQVNGNPTTATQFKNCLFGYNDNTAAVETNVIGSDPVSGNAAFKSLLQHNYRLSKASAAIDKGLAVEPFSPDLDGNLVTDGKPDIGCYEFDLSKEPFDVVIEASASGVLEGATISFKGTEVNPPAGKTLSCLWTLTDGVHEQTSSAQSGAFTVDDAGTYTLSLKVSDAETSTKLLEKTAESTFPIYRKNMTANPGDDLPSIFSGLVAGQTLTLAEGTFSVADTLTLSVGATVTGAGRDKTILDFGGTSKKVVVSDVYASLSNVTIRGIVLNSTGYGVDIARGTFSHSRVTQCAAYNQNYSTSPLYIQIGGKADCLILDHNTNKTSVGYNNWVYSRASAVHVFNGKLRNSLIHDNYTLGYEGTVMAGGNNGGSGLVENCTIVSNLNEGTSRESVALLIGGGGMARNCIVADNRSPNWTTATGDNQGAPSGCAPNWAARATGVTLANSYNNCWGEGAESFGVNPVAENPVKFIAPSAGNWRISAGSACFDAGKLDTSWMSTATDLDGRPRVLHRNKPDLGCYESAGRPGFALRIE